MAAVARRVRRCFVCRSGKCTTRVFLHGNELGTPAPRCEHGPMRVEINRPYRGRPTPNRETS